MLEKSIQYIKGIGPRRAAVLERIGIATIRDALNYFPREYEDRRNVSKIAEALPGTKAVICGTVELAETIMINPRLSVFKAALRDSTGVAYALFFRKVNPYFTHDVFAGIKKVFEKKNTVLVYGPVETDFASKQIRVEEYEPQNADMKQCLHFNRIVPVYPLTEGINQKWFREVMHEIVESYGGMWPDILPGDTLGGLTLVPAGRAIRDIHFPEDAKSAEAARQRLAFDEFYLLGTALEIVKANNRAAAKKREYAITRALLSPFKEKLGFEFTHAQKRAINEIFDDLRAPQPMHRLLLGDVGSGKTVVAASALLLAVENKYQAALLAPTEILAEQHYETLSAMTDGIGVRVALLTGATAGRKKERAKQKKDIASTKADIIIGTHALLEDDVVFKNLGLIVIDEQHRFGVLQRAKLLAKASMPDVLVMTATPIPRTLALTVYGDLDISTIDELPPGRQHIETLHLLEAQAYARVREEIKKGRQAYIVYPLVEESDKLALKAARDEALILSATVFKDFRVGLLHGQMRARDKDKIMVEFRNGAYNILIATTVIEVGIDVPNATMMVIQHAERFGLATLHQLRGRVGRGKDKSYCILLGEPKNEQAEKRILTMKTTNNGFKIAEADLELRGPGEFFGTAQHGMPLLKAGNLIKDVRLITAARECAQKTVQSDKKLQNHEHAALKAELVRLYKGRFGLSRI